jgi:hypothetical protein
VRRHQQLGSKLVEGLDGRLDDGLEHRTAEVEPADHRSDARLTGEPLRVPYNVDDSGVAATREDGEPAIGEPGSRLAPAGAQKRR